MHFIPIRASNEKKVNDLGILQTALSAIDFLISLQSSRVDEFKVTCQSKFEHSTVFKNSAELAVLSKQVLSGGMESDAVP